ncbi:unnamed protein product [Blepharisma stoltei]|uniref:Ubiquitinyl hydrolase 1 n=1 Tax=Blepharisma stoltei TaxID=1481888 RepID=A0AAU9JUS4_9CILI|nr:unnamed protein product [Blepharisma stoltei]
MANSERLIQSAEDFFRENKFQEALDLISSSSLLSNSCDALVLKAKCCIELNIMNEAEQWLNDAKSATRSIKNAKERNDMWERICLVWGCYKEKLGKPKEAQEFFKQIISTSSNQDNKAIAQNSYRRLSSISSPARIPNRSDDELEEFLSEFRENMAVHPGSEWHVVSYTWFKAWQLYIGLTSKEGHEDLPFSFDEKAVKTSQSPGVIDNRDIINQEDSKILVNDPERPSFGISLKSGVQENINYVLLPDPAFQVLKEKHKCSTDIRRYAIEVNDSIYQVEVFLKSIHIGCILKNSVNLSLMNVSRKDTIGEIKRKYLAIKSAPRNAKVWKISLNTISLPRLQAMVKSNEKVYIEGGIILKETTIIDDAEIGEEDVMFIETGKENKFYFTNEIKDISEHCVSCNQVITAPVFCKDCKKIKYCSVACRQEHHSTHKRKCKRPSRSFFACFFCKPSYRDSDEDMEEYHVSKPNTKYETPKAFTTKTNDGATGLQNLGNTCFMNSALQCLAHTECLTNYFLNEPYNKEINKSNPLGTKGKLVASYAEVLEHIYKGNENSFAPWRFKKTLATFAPQFGGYQQHDAHELLCYLLDGLHEDLNQVKKKPYYEDLNTKGKTDQEIAVESWDRHISRNQSIIVNTFHGQYKSTLLCPKCKNYSYTYDPFNSLSLPIPSSQSSGRKLKLYFVKSDPRYAAIRMASDVTENTSFARLREHISTTLNVEPESFIFSSVLENCVIGLPSDDKRIESFKNGTVIAYQADTALENVFAVEVRVTKENSRNKFVTFPRFIFPAKNANFFNLHFEVFKKFVVYIEKLFQSSGNIKKLYEKHDENPCYLLYFKPGRGINCCPLCKKVSCKGCEVPKNEESIDQLFNQRARVVLELVWKQNCSDYGVDLEILNNSTDHPSVSSKGKAQEKFSSISISECFQMFRVAEELEKENAWYCPICKVHVQATKQLEVYKVPPVLIIHLKRFKTHGFYREKLGAAVAFPENGLDISEFVIGPDRPPLYDLFAVSNHFGSLGGGHYTATCRDSQGGWLDFNDSQVKSGGEISNTSAYLLFYKAR